MEKLSELVPELYYDLIGRLGPGAFLSAMLAWEIRTVVPIAGLDGAIALSLGLLSAYIVGFLTDTISSMTIGRLLLLLTRTEKASATWRVDMWAGVSAAPTSREEARLLKMIAQRTMCRSLVLVFLISWIVQLTPIGELSVYWRWITLVALLACWLSTEWTTRREASKYLPRTRL